MLIYSIIFAFLSVSFIKDNIELKYHILYIIWSILIYLVATIGNLCYTLNYSNDSIRKVWRIFFILFILDFIVAGIVDSVFAPIPENSNILMSIVAWTFGLIIFFPAFRANYILGYEGEKGSHLLKSSGTEIIKNSKERVAMQTENLTNNEEVFVTPTWGIAFRVWWTFVWKGLLFGFIAGLVGGLIGGILAGILGPILGFQANKLGGLLGGIFGFIGGLIVSLWILKGILNAEYKDFKIVLMKK